MYGETATPRVAIPNRQFRSKNIYPKSRKIAPKSTKNGPKPKKMHQIKDSFNVPKNLKFAEKGPKQIKNAPNHLNFHVRTGIIVIGGNHVINIFIGF